MRTRFLIAVGLGGSIAAFIGACASDGDITLTPVFDAGPHHFDATSPVDSGHAADATMADAGADAPSTGDSGADADASPPSTVTFAAGAQPDALYWDDAKQTLFITDDTNVIWSWTDAGGLVKLFTLPNTSPDGGAGKLNGITALADGTLVVTQFGFGTFGGALAIGVDGGTTAVPNIAPEGRRIAVTIDPTTGTIYSDSFQKIDGGSVGVVESIDLASGATTIAAGFEKPVGLLVQGTTLVVVDQNVNTVFALPLSAGALADGGLASGGAYSVYASLPSPDQLTSGPEGSVFTGQLRPTVDGGSPQVRQIFPDGGVEVFAADAGFTSISDEAYDPTNKRLFVIDVGATSSSVRIFAVQ